MHTLGITTSLLCGLLNRGEAYLIPTWLMRKQRLAQVKINQSINAVTECVTAEPAQQHHAAGLYHQSNLNQDIVTRKQHASHKLSAYTCIASSAKEPNLKCQANTSGVFP